MLQLPVAASEHAGAIDAMMAHVHWVMLALFVGWSLYFAYLLIRYRAGRQPEPRPEGTRGRLAIIVTAGVVIAEAALLVGSALPLWFERTAPAGGEARPIRIRVVAEQFAWTAHYPGADGEFGDTSISLISDTNPLGLDRSTQAGRDDLVVPAEIHMPVNRAVHIDLSSKDVIHSFGVPAMRVKQDAIPGLRSTAWFTPTIAGQFEVVCSQVCGLGHYRMRGVLVVESDEAFQKFLADEAALQIRR
jgi:cytochrome c oxidase subunit 2